MTPARSPVVRRASLAIALALTLGAESARASEWPSWRGPAQSGVSDETGLVSSWAKDGEHQIWRKDFSGRSTPVVFDGRVCASGRSGAGLTKQEVVACWSAENGDLRWERRFSVFNTTVPFTRVGWGSVTADPETGYLYALNVDGQLTCFDKDGTTVWERRLGEELGRASGYGGRTSNPVVDEDRVILGLIGAIWGDLGGPPRHRYIAFDKRTGRVQWISTPGGNVFDLNTNAVPVVAVINGQRLIIDGNADGWLYAIKARTGEKVWGFQLSKAALNNSVAVNGTTVYVSHSEENIDEGTQGRLVAIDATGTGDITKTHEKWRADQVGVGFSSPLYHDGILYTVDNSANLSAFDAETGALLWQHSLGTVGKGSPVWADGKLYVTEVNGAVHILQPSRSSLTVLDTEEIDVPGTRRRAEIYGSVAVAYKRFYFTTEEGVYGIGDPSVPFRVDPGRTAPLTDGVPAAGATAAAIQVVPAEVLARPGEAIRFEVRAYDDRGRLLGARAAAWTLQDLRGRVAPDGSFSTEATSGSQTGKVVATVGELTAAARVRLVEPLPWAESFETGRPPHWLGGGPTLKVVDIGGEQVLAKGPSPSGLHRHSIYFGPTSMSGYTIQADIMGGGRPRRMPDIGLINTGYMLDLQGNAQRAELRSWEAELRVLERVPFTWEPSVWYTMKLRVDADGARAIVRGKIWRRDETEPADWLVTAEDPAGIHAGSPGLIAYSPVDLYYDNVKVMVSQ